MRPDLTTADRTLLDSGRYDAHWQVEVANGSGTMVDLTGRLAGISLTLPNASQPIGSAVLTLTRELEHDPNASLAPLVAASTLNKLDDGVTYSVLLQVGRAVVARMALSARGAARPTTGYYEVFRGRITRPSWPKYEGGDVVVHCNDQSGALQKSKSQTAYTYAAGTAIETAAQATLDNNGWGTYTSAASTPTGKVLSVQHAPGKQKTVWSQFWAMYQSIGWVAWWRYNGAGTAVLTGFEPDRDKVTSDFTVAGIREVNAIEYSEEEIGNAGYLEYSDASGVRQTVGPVKDTASIAEYGGFERPFWISLPDDSPVRDETGATGLLTQAVSDTADPDALVEIVTPANPFLECSVDMVTVPADGRHYDSAQVLAPFSITVEHMAGRDHQSRINLRGRPSAGKKTWDEKRAVVNDDPESMLLQNFNARDSADGLSEVITWTNGAKLEEVWIATRTVEGNVTAADWSALAAAVESKGLISEYTVTKPTETDGTARVTLIQIEGAYTDPATGDLVTSDAWVRTIKPKVHIAAIDPVTGELAEDAIEAGMLAAGIDPVRVVATLPADNSGGNIVLLTTDRKLYRWNGSGWTAAVATVDLTGTVATAQIADAAITAGKIGAGAVETAKLANLAVTEAVVAAGAITATKIGSLAVEEAKIATAAITEGKIATDAVTANKIFAGSVTAVKVAAGAIETDKLAANAVTAAKIAANTITASQIAAGTITTTQIAANTIVAGNIAAGTISATEIASSAVTTAKLDALAVTADKVAANAITTVKLAANAVEADKVAANAITAGKIATDAVTAGTIAAGAVSTSALAADSVTAAKLSAVAIEAGKYIRSTTYTAGSAGWNIAADGSAEFNNVTIRGTLDGVTGDFAGSLSASTIDTQGTLEIDIAARTYFESPGLKWVSGLNAARVASGDAIDIDLIPASGGYVDFQNMGSLPTGKTATGSFLPIKIGGTIRYLEVYS